MLTNIIILKHTNYYNRQIKKYDTVTDYLQNSNSKYAIYSNINFYKADGVGTSLVLNDASLTNGPVSSYINPTEANYLLEYDTNGIKTRWFILECMQTRAGQYRLSLRRDVIADNYDQVINAKTYIEKATCSANDVAIYNQEDITFNSIKKREELLKDDSENAWIVGYYAPQQSALEVNVPETSVNAIKVQTLESWEYNTYRTNDYKVVDSLEYSIKIAFSTLQSSWINAFRTDSTNYTYVTGFSQLSGRNAYQQQDCANHIYNISDSIRNVLYTTDTSYHKKNDLLSLDGQYLYVTAENKYYKISVKRNADVTSNTTLAAHDTITDGIKNLLLQSNLFTTALDNSQFINQEITYERYTITTTEEPFNSYSLILPTGANQLSDAPYKMFAIPYFKQKFYNNGTFIDSVEAPFSLRIASEIATQLGTGSNSNIYDVQLLPYCPCPEYTDAAIGFWLDISTATENKDFTYIKDGNNANRGVVLFPKQSTFTFDINKSITLPNDAVQRKIIGQCDNYRLCSPNYAAAFDFNLLKTGGISKFNVDCTYKPYSPYIHVNPDWLGLYGKDFNDARGLIVQGDFSIPILNDQWKQYQINNKNYLNSFNRQIESVELNNKYQRIAEAANVVTGVAGGAIAGSQFGGGIGAAVGGVASAAGGIADLAINEKLRSEALDLTKDQFNYSLQNIQALPKTLAKISSFDANNKLFPVLEYYTCTDKEKEIFKDKLIYNGMKIMRIDKIASFISDTEQYIKGRLIRIDIDEDTHMVNTIADELNQGVYL